MNFFKKLMDLKLPFKLGIGLVLILGLLWVTDGWTHAWSNLKAKIYDRNEAKTMKQVDDLQKANEKIRLENAGLKVQLDAAMKRAVESEAKNVLYENKDKQLDAETLAEQVKSEKIFKEIDNEEAITQQPIGAYERCLRFRTTAINRDHLKDAELINCEQFPK